MAAAAGVVMRPDYEEFNREASGLRRTRPLLRSRTEEGEPPGRARPLLRPWSLPWSSRVLYEVGSPGRNSRY